MTVKKIGIDAKWYFEGPPSGRVVVRNLVDNLVGLKQNCFEIYLFIDKRFVSDAEKLFKDRVTIVPVLAKPNILSTSLLIPIKANRLNLDIVISQNYGSLIRAKYYKLVYIHDVLFLDFPEFYSKIEQLYFYPMINLARKADSLITISNSEKDRLVKNKIARKEQIDVVYHGLNNKFIPINRYEQSEILEIENKYNLPNKFLLYVGRINIRKNLRNLLEAFLLVRDKNLKLVIVGKVDHKHLDTQKFIQDNNLCESVLFTGHVPDDELYLIYARAFLFCFPSFAEGFGLPPLEAMKCGVPVIVSNTTSLPEVCGDAGIYVDPCQPKEIALAIDMLSDDDDFYQKKREQSIQHAEKFSWSTAANEILEIAKNRL